MWRNAVSTPAPSIRALSRISWGMSMKNWRSTMRLNALIMTGTISDA
jgi:hypothetical protein